MTTVYIDVYFFINLTVDILAAYFAARTVHIRTSVLRLLIIGSLGGAAAVTDVISAPSFSLSLILLSGFLVSAGIVIARTVSFARRLKFTAALYFFEILIGGGVYYGYLLIERYLSEYLVTSQDTVERRDIVILSVLILFVIGVLKLLILVFGGERFINSVRVKIEIEGKTEEVDALVDSGNLVRDPMSMCPVIFINQALAKRLLPVNVVELTNIDGLNSKYQRRIRLIPVTRNGTTHVMTGVRTDKVTLIHQDRAEEVLATVAIDKGEGSFGGYDALLPSAVMKDGF